MGIVTGVDLFKLMDVAEDLVVPMMDQPMRIDRDSLMLGYAGVYSSFLLLRQARRASATACRRATSWSSSGGASTVGGQEDMIESVALELAAQRRTQ